MFLVTEHVGGGAADKFHRDHELVRQRRRLDQSKARAALPVAAKEQGRSVGLFNGYGFFEFRAIISAKSGFAALVQEVCQMAFLAGDRAGLNKLGRFCSAGPKIQDAWTVSPFARG